MGAIDYKKFLNTTFDNFYLEKIIGEGGMGVVYKAFDRTLNRYVALKVLKKEHITKENKLLERFKLEATNVASLQHPNIINVFSVGHCHGLNYIAMEYVKGDKLSDLLNKNLDLKSSIHIIYKVSKALEYSHAKGIIHRDIKPANIMISDQDCEVKVVDFGLSKPILSGDTNISKFGDIIGTPVYLAPELWESSSNVSVKCDIYSLGIVLYECVTGKYPYRGDTNNSLYKSILLNNYIEAIKINSDISVDLNSLINKMLKREATFRIDIKEVILDLENILNEYDLNLTSNIIRSKNEYNESTIITNKDNDETLSLISKELITSYKKKEKYFIYALYGVIISIILASVYLIF
jgi:serine/threonine protein kinase